MLFKPFKIFGFLRSYLFRVTSGALVWFVVITLLHCHYNIERNTRSVIRMGYMPVITNLAAPLLDQASKTDDAPYRFKAIKFASFAEMAEALRNNEIQAGFIIAPLSIVLRQQGEDVKVVYIGNRHESTLVARKELNVHTIEDLDGHTVAVPMRCSGHNLSILKQIQEAGLEGRVRVVEMNPPDMASALAAGSLDAYYVGEPFAAQTLKAGVSELVFYVESVWPGFICNLLLVRNEYITQNPQAVQSLVQGAVRSGIWAKRHPDKAAGIASRYWGQPVDLVTYALNTPEKRIIYDRFIPVAEEMQQIADLMTQFGLLGKNDVSGLVEDRFAKRSDLGGIGETVESILR